MQFLSEYSQYLSENVVLNLYGFYGFITVLILISSFFIAYYLGGMIAKFVFNLIQKYRKGDTKNSEI